MLRSRASSLHGRCITVMRLHSYLASLPFSSLHCILHRGCAGATVRCATRVTARIITHEQLVEYLMQQPMAKHQVSKAPLLYKQPVRASQNWSACILCLEQQPTQPQKLNMYSHAQACIQLNNSPPPLPTPMPSPTDP